MIEKLIGFCCRNKAIVILFYLGVAVAGIWTTFRTSVDAIPDLSENQVIIFTDWMGRSPKEIEDQITYPLSVNLQGLAGVKVIRSSSEFNFSMVNIIFDDSVDFYFARTRVLERLALANTYLPSGVVPYLAPDATALGQIFWYTVEGENTDLGTLRGLQDWYVRYQLNSVPGVAQVSSVGGFPKEYQVDVTPERLRAYNVSLGDVYKAIATSNSAVGGRVVHKGNAEYLIRGVGWIKSLDDIRNTVIVERDGVPIRVGDVAAVQMGSEFRRSVLEKDGSEVTGGVVMMRYGENPLEVTERVKQKIRDLQSGLPPGVRIVPFYDRTRLIENCIETVTHELLSSCIVASVAILLVLTHVRSVFVVVLTLPISIFIALMFMRYFGISSNIMSLSGITICIGELVDQPIVMLENATHALTKKFGAAKITGDNTNIIFEACRTVGGPLFASLIIMIVSFLPVFALTGQEGKLFLPLAFTKTFVMLGGAIISITLVPALLPLLIRGKLSREEDNWIVRSVLVIYKPMLLFFMKRPKLVIWLFVLLVAVGVHFGRGLGREFMPPLDEGGIMDMPVTVPRASVTEVADDIKTRDALLRGFPEVEMVVGKAGRADTPTDPSPLDMLETIVNMRPKPHWVKRKLRLDDARAEAVRVITLLEAAGAIKPFSGPEPRQALADAAANDALARFDTAMRMEVSRRLSQFDESIADASVHLIGERVLERVAVNGALQRPLSAAEKEQFLAALTQEERRWYLGVALVPDVQRTAVLAVRRLGNEKRLDAEKSDALAPVSGGLKDLAASVAESFGAPRKDFYEETTAVLEELRNERGEEWAKSTGRALFEPAMAIFETELLREMERQARMQDLWNENPGSSAMSVKDLADRFGRSAFLWYKTKQDVIQEMDGAVRQLGWANIWTQPIINRVDMLATGVRTQLAAKVFGRSQEQIQDASNQVAEILRGIAGAADVVADQTVGKGYVEIEVDRQRAARYGVSVGDIQEIIEVALGGKPITTTVEGRDRYPVRLRYARDSRVDEQSIADILVSPGGGAKGMGGTPSSVKGQGMAGPGSASPAAAQPAIYFKDVATIKVVEGPVVIKSENGLLRSYVQLNVRDRDIVGFVEEAQRAVAAKVKLPEGSYIEWTGQFEHQMRAKKTLTIVFPVVIVVIFLILYLTYRDFTHAALIMLSIPGALAGGVLFQVFFGYNFSVAVWVGYIACFGIATETGIIMVVYLREAIEERGGLAKIASLAELDAAIVTGAVHRLRPKLLTEGASIVGLAPMLWFTGPGAEIIAPMAAPLLGGLLMADEVIDVFLPVLFYQVEARRWRKLHPEAQPVLTNTLDVEIAETIQA